MADPLVYETVSRRVEAHLDREIGRITFKEGDVEFHVPVLFLAYVLQEFGSFKAQADFSQWRGVIGASAAP